jgi:serine/threonine protein kinase/tetratricopeptide (TPR) repeat protein
MPADPHQARQLFLHAVGKLLPAQWDDYVSEASGDDFELQQQVRRFLQVHREAGSFLEWSADPLIAAVTEVGEAPGTVIGPYKLLEQIGEGGFGMVFMAEQQHPVRRKVALKILKPGMDSRQIIARFEAERQALALMDHPHIARVLDAGQTAAGRPYFVMDLVKGIPITEYCDQAQLATHERLQLFVPVCQAIQHAHQKGIVHRDIKPSNVLVTLRDGAPVPKVIDFGIAKATSGQLTEKTLFTNFAQMMGTPLYMSPEQAGLSELDVDTRSDIYSLGVLLYELLTGTTPFDKERFKEAGYDEMRRIIREEEPSKPSTRLSTLGQAATTLSIQRRSDPRKLSELFRGELDWIVMKALEKDRNRRYETADAFALDVERYLHDEPVLACPPSANYRLRKFSWKHRKVLAVAGAFAMLLTVATGVSLALAIWAHDQRDKALAAAEKERVAKESAQKRLIQIEKGNEILGSIFRDLDPRNEEKEGKPLRRLLGERLEDAASQLKEDVLGAPAAVARLQITLGKSLYGLGYPEKAIPLLLKARDTLTAHAGPDDSDTLTAMNNLALAYRTVGRLDLAIPLNVETLNLMKEKFGPDDRATLACMNNLASAYRNAGKLDLALPLLEETLELRKAKFGPDNPATLKSMSNLALGYQEARKFGLAIPLLQEALERSEARMSPDHPTVIGALNNLALAYIAAGKLHLALPRYEEALQRVTAKLGPDHPNTLITMRNLGGAYQAAGQMDQALALLERAAAGVEKRGFAHEHADRIIAGLTACHEERQEYAQAEAWRRKWLAVLKQKSGSDTVAYAAELTGLGSNLVKQKKWLEAEAVLHEALAIRQRQEADSWTTFSTQSLLGQALLGRQKYAEAEPLLLQGHEGMKSRAARIPKGSRSCLADGVARLVELYDAWGKKDEAARWRVEFESEKSR